MTFTFRLSIIVWVVLLLTACDSQPAAAPQQGAQAVPVDVAEVIAQPLTEWDSFTGRLEAPEHVELRPRVSGYIEFVAFDEGEWVEQGDTLFLIDNRAFKAEVDRLSAQLKQAKSQLSLTDHDYERVSRLRESQSVSEEVLDNRRSASEQASANVAAIEAALDLAKLNRGFARVEAPISGRVSRANITEGNYVTAGQTVLTRIVSTHPLYAYFDIDEQTYLRYADSCQDGNAVNAKPVAMRRANDEEYHFWGNIDFVDNQVNANTGTIRVRAVFDNTHGALLPGMFAHLKLAGQTREAGILIAEKAIGTDLNNKYVLVVNQDNVAEYRPVKLGDKMGTLRLIESGLNPSDSIVVDGLQRIRPGVNIAPTSVPMATEDSLSEIMAWQERVTSFDEVAQRSSTRATVEL
ncbi:efflux RND transporter periplasmic adaptor subunit [Alteromonas antoniana]|uniref:efflux RND transporter periplasmic adaptor subunit n=1 Tax=Alteromonas antoniana TaxID=2803813 RepID=UPI001C46A68D|nr:efflux RND transporter periplasmic adaptor subunit [Alteromonas antoniana]